MATSSGRLHAHRSQCGRLASVCYYLRSVPAAAQEARSLALPHTLLVLICLSVGVTSVPRIAFPGRREGRILAPATAIATFLGCNVANKYRLRIQAGCKLAEIAESVHGLVIIQCEVMDCLATLAHERGGPVSCGARLPTAFGWIVANAAWRTSARRSWST